MQERGEIFSLIIAVALRSEQKKTKQKKTASAAHVKYFLWLNQLTATNSNKMIEEKKNIVYGIRPETYQKVQRSGTSRVYTKNK